MVQYIRNRKKQRIGVMIAFEHQGWPNTVLVGFSKCNMPLDHFDKASGIFIAEGRAFAWEVIPKEREVPHSVREPLKKFIGRCKVYYKGKTFPKWVDTFMKGE